MAAHHSYISVICPVCEKERTARKDLVDKKNRLGEKLLCKSCAMKSRPVTWGKPPEEIVRNQGAYKSYTKAKRRVEENHKNAYAHVKFNFESYEEFLTELGPRPDGMTLDRIDPNGNYEPGNVRWATIQEQSRNRRGTIFINYKGQKMCIKDAAEASGLDRGTIKRRLEKGYPEEMIFMQGRIDF